MYRKIPLTYYKRSRNADGHDDGDRMIMMMMMMMIMIMTIIIIIIIITIINILSFMYGIYTYIPQTNHAPRGYIVAANLSIHSLVLISVVPALVL